jgi:hypothetical protein
MIIGGSRGSAAGGVSMLLPNSFANSATWSVTTNSTGADIVYCGKVYAAGESTSYTATIDSAEASNSCISGYIAAFRGVDLARARAYGYVSSNCSTSNAVVSTVVTPTATAFDTAGLNDGGMAIAIVTALGTGGTGSVPSGWTAAGSATTSAAPIGNSVGAYIRTYPAGTAASGAPAITGTTSTTKIGVQVALWPDKPTESVSGTSAFVRGYSQQSAYYSDTTVYVPKPPATQTGDLMIMACSADNGVAYSAVFTTPTGWTPLTGMDVSSNVSGGAGSVQLYYRFATASDPSAFTVPHYGGSGGVDAAFDIVSFGNAAVPTRWLSNINTTGSSAPAAPSIAGEPNAELLTLYFAGSGSATARRFTTPNTLTKWSDVRAHPLGWVAQAFATMPLTSTAATGAQTATLESLPGLTGSWAALSNKWGALSIIIPAAAAVGSVAMSGSGGLSFGAGVASVAGAISLSGSGSTTFVDILVAVNGITATATAGMSIASTGLSRTSLMTATAVATAVDPGITINEVFSASTTAAVDPSALTTHNGVPAATAIASPIVNGYPAKSGPSPATATVIATISTAITRVGASTATAATTSVIAPLRTAVGASIAVAVSTPAVSGYRATFQALAATAKAIETIAPLTSHLYQVTAVAVFTATINAVRTIQLRATISIDTLGSATFAAIRRRISTAHIDADIVGGPHSVTGMQGVASLDFSTAYPSDFSWSPSAPWNGTDPWPTAGNRPTRLTLGPPARFDIDTTITGRLGSPQSFAETISADTNVTGNLRVVQSLTTILEEDLPALLTAPPAAPEPETTPEPAPAVPVYRRTFFGVR